MHGLSCRGWLFGFGQLISSRAIGKLNPSLPRTRVDHAGLNKRRNPTWRKLLLQLHFGFREHQLRFGLDKRLRHLVWQCSVCRCHLEIGFTRFGLRLELWSTTETEWVRLGTRARESFQAPNCIEGLSLHAPGTAKRC